MNMVDDDEDEQDDEYGSDTNDFGNALFSGIFLSPPNRTFLLESNELAVRSCLHDLTMSCITSPSVIGADLTTHDPRRLTGPGGGRRLLPLSQATLGPMTEGEVMLDVVRSYRQPR